MLDRHAGKLASPLDPAAAGDDPAADAPRDRVDEGWQPLADKAWRIVTALAAQPGGAVFARCLPLGVSSPQFPRQIEAVRHF